MIAVVTILCAFPLGFFLSSRLAANTTYAVAYLWAFVFQTLYLVLDAMNESSGAAFERQEFPLAYGVVTLSIFVGGFGLVALGHRVGRGRRERRQERGQEQGQESSRSSLTGTIASAASGKTAASANVAG
ncbi:hypothetical protein [Nocardioides halotolerans]|jgi:hypothetical protein|uniref:hypothetical protein n=1 Tax=Nocardioides halotolerans TaxID=433660 RepID=UPI00048D78CF|nr:hypothetical protein [Nocardioides halotolerans]